MTSARGRLVAGGWPVALTDIRVLIFAVDTDWDHVAPWRSTYKVHLLSNTNLDANSGSALELPPIDPPGAGYPAICGGARQLYAPAVSVPPRNSPPST